MFGDAYHDSRHDFSYSRFAHAILYVLLDYLQWSFCYPNAQIARAFQQRTSRHM